MKIRRWHARKVNTGNYTTADFGAEYIDEVEDWKAVEERSKLLHKVAKEDVDKSIEEFLKEKEKKDEEAKQNEIATRKDCKSCGEQFNVYGKKAHYTDECPKCEKQPKDVEQPF